MKTHPPAIILIRPQMGENIGAAARAMANFGLTDLRLVAPRDGWPNQAAIDNAAGALGTAVSATVFDTPQEAISDLHFVLATTARRREITKPVYTPQESVNNIFSRPEQKTGLVFGPERTGLENDEIALCQAIINVPTDPDFSSLNLGQCVLLMGYEWLKTQDKTPHKNLETGKSFPATQDTLEEFLNRLEEELDQARFFRDDGLKPTMIRNIRAMFARSELTDQEVRTLHGIISALKGKKHQDL